MSIRLTQFDQFGHDQKGGPANLLSIRLAQQYARSLAQAVSGLTDGSGGTATSPSVITVLASGIDTVASGSNLLSVTPFNASLVKIGDALAEVAATSRTLALAVGAPVVAYDGAATNAPDGTIGALDLTATATTVGPSASHFAAVVLAYNEAMFGLASWINGIAAAVGVSSIGFSPAQSANVPAGLTIPGAALPLTVGTASATGVTAAVGTAFLAQAAVNVATLAEKVNEMVTIVHVLADSSGGTANVYGTVTALGVCAADADVSSSAGSTVATTNTSLIAVVTAMATLAGKINQVAKELDLPLSAYAGGGSVSNTTVAVIGDSGTAGNTGATKALLDPVLVKFDGSFAELAKTVNAILKRVALGGLSLKYTAAPAAPSAITVTQVFNATGQTKVAVDALLATAANNVATLTAAVNAAVSRVNGPMVSIRR